MTEVGDVFVTFGSRGMIRSKRTVSKVLKSGNVRFEGIYGQFRPYGNTGGFIATGKAGWLADVYHAYTDEVKAREQDLRNQVAARNRAMELSKKLSEICGAEAMENSALIEELLAKLSD